MGVHVSTGKGGGQRGDKIFNGQTAFYRVQRWISIAFG
jgi:hypothetical protein